MLFIKNKSYLIYIFDSLNWILSHCLHIGDFHFFTDSLIFISSSWRALILNSMSLAVQFSVLETLSSAEQYFSSVKQLLYFWNHHPEMFGAKKTSFNIYYLSLDNLYTLQIDSKIHLETKSVERGWLSHWTHLISFWFINHVSFFLVSCWDDFLQWWKTILLGFIIK